MNERSTNVPGRLITSRNEFLDALRFSFEEVASKGSREIWLCDDDFSDWPLGERAVVDQLQRWALSSRKLTLMARSFDEVSRRHARWVEWRRNWSHIVSCRTNTELGLGEFPTLFVAYGTVTVRLSDTAHHRGRLSHEKADEQRCKELLDAVLQRSEEAFPATTTGL
jgi:hypothetical protein